MLRFINAKKSVSKVMKVAMAVGLSISMLICSNDICFARVGTVTAYCRANYASGKYDYGKEGHQLKVLLNYVEINRSIGRYYSGNTIKVVNGANKAVAISRTVTGGRSYSQATVTGYYDGHYGDSSFVFTGL